MHVSAFLLNGFCDLQWLQNPKWEGVNSTLGPEDSFQDQSIDDIQIQKNSETRRYHNKGVIK